MHRMVFLACITLVAACATVWSEESGDDKFHVAIVTDSRGAPGQVLMGEDAKAGDDVIPHADLWPARVAAIPGVEAHYPAQGRRSQLISAIPAMLEDDDRVYDLFIIQCGHDDYHRPEVNKARLKQRAEAGEIPAEFIEDLKTRDFEIRGSDFEKHVFDTLRDRARKIIYVTINLKPFDEKQKETERFKELNVFDAIVELPMADSWADEMTYDGAHYNAAGHAYVAEQVIPLVEKFMQEGKETGA